MDKLANASLGVPLLLAGMIFIVVGILPVTKISIAGTEALLGKPLKFWQRSIFTMLGVLFLSISLLPGKGIISKKPNSIQFTGMVCKVSSEYLNLSGERIFLRSPEFKKLSLPLGSSVSLQRIDGTDRTANLTLDNDTSLNQCPFLVNKKTRIALDIDTDTDQKPSERSVHSWIIKGSR